MSLQLESSGVRAVLAQLQGCVEDYSGQFLSLFFPPRELKYGIPVTDENGNRLGESTSAARQAIIQVVVSRIGMAVPAMGERPPSAGLEDTISPF